MKTAKEVIRKCELVLQEINKCSTAGNDVRCAPTKQDIKMVRECLEDIRKYFKEKK
jgi:hypothetical protein